MTKLTAQCNIFKNISAFNSARFLSICHSVYFKKLYRAGDRRVPHNSKTNDEQILTALNSCRMAQSEKGLGLASIHWSDVEKNFNSREEGQIHSFNSALSLKLLGFTKCYLPHPLIDCSTKKVWVFLRSVHTTPFEIKGFRTESDFRSRMKSILNSTVWDFKLLVTEIVNCLLSSECLDKICYITES